MRKIFTFLIAVFILLNLCFGGLTAQTALGAVSGFNFEWAKSYVLNETLNQVSRGSKKDSVMLWWDLGMNDGISFEQGVYNLSYNLENDKRIDLKVEKNGPNATVTYNVFSYSKNAYIDVNDSLYSVYRNTASNYIVKPTQVTYPAISEGYEIVYGPSGNPDNVQFNIMRGQGFCFKFDNRMVSFYWSGTGANDVFFYCTDGAAQGNVYEFDLELSVSGVQTNKVLNIFTGVNQNTFTSQPIANNGRGTSINPINHDTVPIETREDPGDISQLELTFDKPKYWDQNTNKFVYGQSEKTSVVMDLGNQDPSKKIQITVADIYEQDINSVTSVATACGATVEARNNAEEDKVILLLSGLTPGIIFNPVEISLFKPADASFLSDFSSIGHGVVYTYPKFYITPVDTYEYYIEIEPFAGYRGFYEVRSGISTQSMTKWAEYEDKTGGASNVFIPVSLNAVNPQLMYFQVIFRFTPPDTAVVTNQVSLNSQYLQYRTSPGDICISTPKNLKIIESLVSQTTEKRADGSYKEVLYLTLRWDAVLESVIESIMDRNGGSLTVDYTFNRAVAPYGKDEIFATLPITYKHGDDGGVVVDMDKMRETISNNPVVKDFAEDVTSYEVLIGTETENYLQHQIMFELEIVSSKQDIYKAGFEYPNVYFLNLSGSYTDGANPRNPRSTKASLPVSLTVDYVSDAKVLPPQNFKLIEGSVGLTGDKSSAEFAVDWDIMPQTSVEEYINLYITKRGLTFDAENSIRFDAYISTGKDSLKKYDDPNYVKEYKIENTSNNQLSFDLAGAPLKDESAPYISPTAWFHKNTDTSDMNVVKIPDIRQGQYGGKLKIGFDNASKNQDYYMVIYAYIVPAEESGNKDYKPEYSLASGIVTITTPDDTEKPVTGDREPEAPKNFSPLNGGISFDSVILKWDQIDYNVNYDDPENYNIEYELIRIKDKRFEDKSAGYSGNMMTLETKEPFESCVNLLKAYISSEISGFKGDSKGGLLYKWNGASFDEAASPFEYSLVNKIFNLTDASLSPNVLYFYYIRTVKTDKDGNKQYSVWVPTNATTTPVGQIKNLRAERSDEAIKNYETKTGKKLNEKTETLVSFSVPKFDDTKTDLFQFKYSLKPDGGTWSEDKILNVNEYYDKSAEDANGYITYYYRISGLKTGSAYNLRVKFYDKTLDSESSYSNIIQIRTEVDEGDNDFDNKTNDWLDYYKEELEKIGREPYWLLDYSENTTKAFYKTTHFGGLAAGAGTSVIPLTKGDGAEESVQKTYFMPAANLKSAFDTNKGFIISYENADLILANGFINPGENETIKEINNSEIKTKEAVDYCAKITIDFNDYRTVIDDSRALSPTAAVSIDIYSTTELLTKWETRMQELLRKRIDDPKLIETAKKEIQSEINDESTNEEMVIFIKELVDEFKEDFCDEVDDEFDDILDTRKSMEKLDGTLYYAYPVDSQTVAVGYERSLGYYNTKDIMDYNGKKAVFGSALTSYLIAGRTINLPGLAALNNATRITMLLSKYGLDTYFTPGVGFNLNAPVTKTMVTGSASKLMGAKGSFDISAFMAAEGVIIGGRGMDEPVTTQEALYYLMLVYEKRTNTKIETMTVRNYSLTANMKGLTPKYKKSVQIALETGICATPVIDPNASMSVKDFLQALVNLADKTNL